MLQCLLTVLWWIAIGVLTVLLLVVVDLLRMPRSRFHSWISFLYIYFMRRVMMLVGCYGWWRRVRASYSDVIGAQEQFVLSLLRQNAASDYGREHRFFEMKSLQDFRRLHPVTEYEHYKAYIERAMEGDLRAMYGAGEKVLMYGCSSGTTGTSKYIPTTSASMKNTWVQIMGAGYGIDRDGSFPSNLQKVMFIACAPRWRYTNTGVRIGPVSGVYLDNPMLSSQQTLPSQAAIIKSEAEAVHVGFVLGLRDRDVFAWEAGFAFGLWNQLQFLEQHWRTIVQDIGAGRLSPELNLSERQRATIDALLTPDPDRAAELHREFERGFDGILPRLFPSMKVVSALYSGSSMAVYRERCMRYLGGIPMQSRWYGASEGMLGLNVRGPNQSPAYALIPGCSLIEFLPVDESGEAEADAAPLLATEVEIGRLYEVIATTSAGLYRYRLGDVVRVVGSFHQSPTFDFEFRAKQMLNVHMEKVSEAAFTAALQQAVAGWSDQRLVDFTTAESVLDPAPGAGPPHYLVLLELSGDTAPTQEQLGEIDSTLQQQHFVYKSFRVKDAIGPMRVVLVAAGTFAAYRQHVFDTTQTIMQQYKQPRVLRTQEKVQFFLDRAM